MTAERKRNMARVTNAPEVHFEGPDHERTLGGPYPTGVDITLCGVIHTGFAYTREPVTCIRCLALHRWVHQHRREASDA